jgi:hypothetical protein
LALDHFHIERAGRRAIMRTGGMADIDLGMLVHAFLVTLKHVAAERHYPVVHLQKWPLAMHQAPK